MRLGLMAGLLLVLLGCQASSAKYMRGPDGEPGWVAIECHSHQSDCYARAAMECPEGYDVADRTGAYGSRSVTVGTGSYNGTTQATATRTPLGYDVNGTTSGTYDGTSVGVSKPVYEGELFIKCKGRGYAHASGHDSSMDCKRDADCPWQGYTCQEGRCTGP